MFCTRCLRAYEEPAPPACPRDGAPLTRAPEIGRVRTTRTELDGQVFGGKYEIKGLLGEGGMSRVYLAQDRTTLGVVALKMLHERRVRDRVACERFMREARAAEAIGHPNIIRTLFTHEGGGAPEPAPPVAAGLAPRPVTKPPRPSSSRWSLRASTPPSAPRASDAPWLALEFLFGESLGELLRRDEVVDVAFLARFMKQAASALGAAHAVGIVHRDVKPDNLFLVGERGDPYELKVVDFGLAKLDEGALTATGTAVGTMEYMAPEQILVEPVDGRADQYALGVVMFRMIAGQLPFSSRDDATLLASHIVVAPPRPGAIRAGVDPRLEAVVLRLLRKNVANRYPSMEALVEDLERLAGERAGPLAAAAPDAAPDVCIPQGTVGRTAASFFYRRVGLGAPPWEDPKPPVDLDGADE